METVRLTNVRVGHLDKVLTKSAPKGTTNEPKFSCAICFDSENVPQEINAMISSAIAEGFPNGYPAGARPPIRRDKKAWLPDGLAFFTASTQYAPQVFDKSTGEEITMPNDRRLKSGAYCDVLIKPYTYNKAGNIGVGYSLDGILVLDTPFEEFPKAGGVDAAAMFGLGQPQTQAATAGNTSSEGAW